MPYILYSEFTAQFSSPIYKNGVKKMKHPELSCEIGLINWYQCVHCVNVQHFIMPYLLAS